MKNKKILISGAGVAGLTLAYWLKRYGFSPTLIERNPSLRIGGYKVDIRGSALEVVKRMDLHAKISALKTDVQGATVVDGSGNIITEMSGDTFGYRVSEDLEIIRGDLCQILMEQVSDVECIFGDSVTAMSEGSDGVQVEFEKNQSRRFDLVIGADGLHSTVRKLVFGKESNFAHELGMYLSIFTVPNYLNLDRWEMEFSDGKRLVNIYSSKRDPNMKAGFLFVSKPIDIDFRDTPKQKQLLVDVYAGIGWEIPKLLDLMHEAADFYFDSATQIKMDHWSKDRTALIGDAGFCASPLSGQGTSLALVAAYVLASELKEAAGNYREAFAQYEKLLRHYVDLNQKLGQTFANNMTAQKKNKIVVWLHEILMRIVPGKVTDYMTQRTVNRVNRAANAITLKSY